MKWENIDYDVNVITYLVKGFVRDLLFYYYESKWRDTNIFLSIWIITTSELTSNISFKKKNVLCLDLIDSYVKISVSSRRRCIFTRVSLVKTKCCFLFCYLFLFFFFYFGQVSRRDKNPVNRNWLQKTRILVENYRTFYTAASKNSVSRTNTGRESFPKTPGLGKLWDQARLKYIRFAFLLFHRICRVAPFVFHSGISFSLSYVGFVIRRLGSFRR